ncbi:MAG: dockerin type I domain-containing protein [Saprospiraceae bacterium]
MKKFLLALFALLGVVGYITAQKQNNIWFFGNKAGLDFNFTPPKAITSALFTLEGTASISDPAGHLLFYTNGATLWDRNQNPMPNGSGLLGGESSTQAALIVPLPNSCTQYYVFTTEDQFTNGGLAYSVVDMCLHDGLGDVVASTKNTLVIDRTTEKVTAVLHANGVDIWILTHTHSSNKFQAYLLTSSGLTTTPVVSTIGSNYSSTDIIGPIRASHDGSKIVSSASFGDICEMFDFNNTTGVLSNAVNLNSHWSGSRSVYGIEFSPDDHLLYLSTFFITNYLYQLNLATNVLTTLNSVSGNYRYGALQMGPDKKIYMVRNESAFVDVIHQPNVSGTGCQYVEHSLDLLPGTKGQSGLPNFAPYSFFQDSTSSISLGHDTTICAGDSIILHVQSNKNCPSSYVWNDGSTDPEKIVKTTGLYWVRVESSCAKYIDSIEIDVVPTPDVTLENAVICTGEVITLDASFPGSTYLWSDHSISPQLTVSVSGIYTVTVSNACSTITASANISVVPPSHLSFVANICQGSSFEGYTESGIYTDTLITELGCDSIRVLTLTVIPGSNTFLERDLCSGGSFEGYTKSGIYVDTFNLVNGCDSIRTLRLNVIDCTPIVQYDLEACSAFMFNGSNMDYSEFLPTFPSQLTCADVSADYLFRSPPQMNKHSCTHGVNGSIAMCVSSLNSCTYIAGHQASIVIEFTIHPQTDSLVKFTGLEFYEQAPTNYNWISGDSGPNNFPTFYGIRILKNGLEVFRKENIHTTNSWTLQSYSFIDNDLFRVQANTTFRIELLPYCPIGDASVVSAWDIDAVKIYAGCIAIQSPKPIISGRVITRTGLSVSNATMVMSEDADFSNVTNKPTDAAGHYAFENLEKDGHYFLKGYKNDDVLNGVSTLDLIRIQKHLLGIEPFTSLHQYIAADVNHSGRVTVLDLLDLRRLLLGLYNEFPGNTSWRFGDMAQEMGGADISLFSELKTIEYPRHDIDNADFLGIKIGDVNEDIKLLTGNLTSRSEKTFSLMMENEEIKEMTPFTVAIKAGEHTSIAGLQMALQIEDLELVGISSEKLFITPENFAVHNGVLSISWSQSESILLEDEDELYQIKFIAHHAGQVRDKIKLTKERLCPEAYPGNDLESYAIHLECGKQISNLQEISFFQLEPNPFHSAFTTRFYLVNGGKTTIRFFDVSGKLLYTTEHEYSSGEHVEQINGEDIPLNNGIVYCQLICNGYTAMQRIMKF